MTAAVDTTILSRIANAFIASSTDTEIMNSLRLLYAMKAVGLRCERDTVKTIRFLADAIEAGLNALETRQ